MTRRFLIAFDKLPIESSSVKSGNSKPEVIVACRCINVGLFISGNLRRDVEVSITMGSQDDLQVISFSGQTLKRVSPDERSIAFFLLKATVFLKNLDIGISKTMDNGIVVRRTNLKSLIEEWSPPRIFSAEVEISSIKDTEILLPDGLYVYDFDRTIVNLDHAVKMFRPPHPERFILNVNLNFD
ncbi:MAG: hypothetical protein ACXABD_22675 [Candidatus Thorarchaeota archaeon]|jgi:tRNA pseudouridine-54 N-methylase